MFDVRESTIHDSHAHAKSYNIIIIIHELLFFVSVCVVSILFRLSFGVIGVASRYLIHFDVCELKTKCRNRSTSARPKQKKCMERMRKSERESRHMVESCAVNFHLNSTPPLLFFLSSYASLCQSQFNSILYTVWIQYLCMCVCMCTMIILWALGG